MNVYRAPSTGKKWIQTGSKSPDKYIEDWKPGNTIIGFNGAIDGVLRITEIGVQIEENDVIALFNGLVKNYRERQDDLSSELEALRAERVKLRSAMRKINRVIRLNPVSNEDLKKLRSTIFEALYGTIQD